MSLIKYIEVNKLDDNDWVKIQATNKEQTKFYCIFIAKVDRELLVHSQFSKI